MGVVNGQAVSAEVTNPAFIDANQDDQTLAKLGLNDQDLSLVSGTAITNSQREFNALWSFIGGLLNQSKTYMPTWATNTFGNSSNTLIQRVAAIDAAFAGNQTFSGNKTLNGKLILNNEFLTNISSDNTSSGQLDNVSTFGINYQRFTLATKITGFANGDDGKEVVIVNANSTNLIISENDSSSTTANRILTGSGDVTLSSNMAIRIKYDSLAFKWRVIGGTGGGSFIGKHETPTGPVDGTNKDFTISALPITDTIIFLKNGLALKTSDYSYSNPTITLVDAPLVGEDLDVFYLTLGGVTPPAPTGLENVEYKTLSNGNISTKQLTLANTPISASKVVLDVIGGSAQIYSTDFIVTGNILSWASRGLDGQVSPGDIFRIFYFS